MNENAFVCPKCGNKDERYIGHLNGKPYCRRCISFIGETAAPSEVKPSKAPLILHYPLSDDQKRISEKIQQNYLMGIDTLVYAVCGAGKTELSYGVIATALRAGKQVGFALPRRDVVIELFWRIKEAFPENKVVAVYGDHTYDLVGDIIILTTHQLYRYRHYFDLLVMDEIDAFPFKGNEVLISMYEASKKGPCVMMSATPSEAILKEFKKPNHDIVELRTRFHKKPIPVPRFVRLPVFLQKLYLIKKLKEYKEKKKPCFVFVSTIEKCRDIFQFLRIFQPNGNYVSSVRKKRDEIIGNFKKGKYDYLVTTSVLERGVTIKNLQIIVFGSDDERIYSSSTLIQIAGRAGRKMDAPDGEVIFLSSRVNKHMEKAKHEIEFCNTFL